MKRLLVLVLLALVVLPLSACAPKVNDAADVQAVKQTVEAYATAANAGDAEGVVAMMTDKTIYADNHFPVAVGKAAVQSMGAAQSSLFTTEFQAPVDEVRVVGDVAVARGTWKVKLTPKTEGIAPISDSGSWMLLATRQADGSWKWDCVVPNSNQPMPGTTADGAEEQALMQIERDWAVALEKRDVTALDRILAKEWSGSTNGQNTSRTQALADHKAGVYQFESFAVRDLSVHVFGDSAVATMIVVIKGKYKGNDISGSERSTDFFVRRDGRWQAVSSQNVTIKP